MPPETSLGISFHCICAQGFPPFATGLLFRSSRGGSYVIHFVFAFFGMDDCFAILPQKVGKDSPLGFPATKVVPQPAYRRISYAGLKGVRRVAACSRTGLPSKRDRLRPWRKPSAAKHPLTGIIREANGLKQTDGAKRGLCVWGRLRDATGDAATDGDGAASRSSLRTWLPPSANPAGLRRKEASRA